MQQQHRPLGNTLQRNGHERPQSFPGAKERHESVSKQHRAAQPTGPLAAPYHGAHSAGQRSYPQPSRGNTETTRITQPKRRRPLELSGSDGCGKSPHAHAPAFSFLPPSLPPDTSPQTGARRAAPFTLQSWKCSDWSVSWMSLSLFPACCCCEADDAEAAEETAVNPSSTFLMLNFLMVLGGGAARSAGLAAPGAAARPAGGRRAPGGREAVRGRPRCCSPARGEGDGPRR